MPESGQVPLLYEMHRIIGDIKPRWVVVENVAALLSRGMDVVLRDLSTIGYDCEWHVIPASSSWCPKWVRRERVWIIARLRFGVSKEADAQRANANGKVKYRKKKGVKGKAELETNKTVSLDRWAKMFPTPTSSMRPCEGTVRLMRQRWQDGTVTLEEANAIAGRDVRKSQCRVPAMFPTPSASEHKYRLKGNSQQSKCLNALAGGNLETRSGKDQLMGFPEGWTDLKDYRQRGCSADCGTDWQKDYGD